MNYTLPTSVEVGGRVYGIRSDFRAALDILAAIGDVDLSDQERGEVALTIFYPQLEEMPPEDYPEALSACLWFIGCGESEPEGNRKRPKLMDWEQDFPLAVAPINRVLGQDIRGMEYLHWWTLVAAYQEIGDCTFGQIVSIRQKLATGQKLDQGDRMFYRQNRHLIDIKQRYTQEESDTISSWV